MSWIDRIIKNKKWYAYTFVYKYDIFKLNKTNEIAINVYKHATYHHGLLRSGYVPYSDDKLFDDTPCEHLDR